MTFDSVGLAEMSLLKSLKDREPVIRLLDCSTSDLEKVHTTSEQKATHCLRPLPRAVCLLQCNQTEHLLPFPAAVVGPVSDSLSKSAVGHSNCRPYDDWRLHRQASS